MDKHSENESSHKSVPAKKTRRKKPLWAKILIWLFSIVVGLAVLIVALIGVVVWYLTPPKITPIAEKFASEYLDAEVKIGRLELTYWSTFPTLKVKVDTLSVVSNSLNSLSPDQRALLPEDADSLLWLKRLEGSVNLPKLLANKVELRNVVIDNPIANVVIYNDSVTNFNIFPPSGPNDTTSTASSMPEISFNRFSVLTGLKARYFSLPDTTDVALQLNPVEFDTEKAPHYILTTSGNARIKLGEMALPPLLTFSMDGSVTWNPKQPEHISIENFKVGVGPVNAVINTSLNFKDKLIFEEGSFELLPLDVSEVMAWLPEEYTASLQGLKTNMSVALTATLLEPYSDFEKLPSVSLSFSIPECSVSYMGMNLNEFMLEGSAIYEASHPAASSLKIKRLRANGEGVNVDFHGTATNLLDNPHIKGTLKSSINFARVPAQITEMLPFALSGIFRADATVNLRPSYLNRLDFHKINVEGNASLENFGLMYPDSTESVYVRRALLKFGSQTNVQLRNGNTADSLLTMNLSVDTFSYVGDSLMVNGLALKAGLGISNKAESADSGKVVPLGVNLSADRLRYRDLSDSSSVIAADPKIFGIVRRYEGSTRRALFTAGVKSRFIRYRTPNMMMSFSEPTVNLKMYPSAKPRMNATMTAIYDSIQAANPGLRADSVYARARREQAISRRARRAAGEVRVRNDSNEILDLRADKETRSLLLWWNVSGNIKAKRGRLITPYFPLRNSLRNVDITFDMDTTTIRNTTFKSGRSDFLINGTISNYTEALTRRNAMLNVSFTLTGDTIDVNQLVDAAFLGSAYAEKVADDASSIAIGELESEDNIQQAVDASAADSVNGPLLMPMNLNARLRVRSKTALYDGIKMENFRGSALIRDGALSLRELSANTEAGHIGLNMLYDAPTKNSIKLGMGLVLNNFHIERFTKLFPTLDSIMPALNTLSGRINAEMAATTDIEPNMDLNLQSLSALLTIKGDSLVVIDPDTYKTVAKWLMFKDKHHNMIDSISAQLSIEDGTLEVYPFIFNFDRYKLGVMGNSDMAMNLNYHVSVLKSPIPFKFGINIKGTTEHMKISLGGAKIKPDMAVEKLDLVTNSRINLIEQMDAAFAKGMRNARMNRLRARDGSQPSAAAHHAADTDSISAADSLYLINAGLIEIPVENHAPKEKHRKHSK